MKTYHLPFVLHEVWSDDSKEWSKAELQSNMAQIARGKMVSLTARSFHPWDTIQDNRKYPGYRC